VIVQGGNVREKRKEIEAKEKLAGKQYINKLRMSPRNGNSKVKTSKMKHLDSLCLFLKRGNKQA